MKKILSSVIIIVLISSCSIPNSLFILDNSTIKIDYVKNQLVANNNTGKDFSLKIISKDADRKTSTVLESNTLQIKQGADKYKLNMYQVSNSKLLGFENYGYNAPKNTITIYTKSEQFKSNDGFDLRLVSYIAKSNFSEDNAKVFFNTFANLNLYMRVESLPVIGKDGFGENGAGATVDVSQKHKGQILLVGVDEDGNNYASSGGIVEPL